ARADLDPPLALWRLRRVRRLPRGGIDRPDVGAGAPEEVAPLELRVRELDHQIEELVDFRLRHGAGALVRRAPRLTDGEFPCARQRVAELLEDRLLRRETRPGRADVLLVLLQRAQLPARAHRLARVDRVVRDP